MPIGAAKFGMTKMEGSHLAQTKPCNLLHPAPAWATLWHAIATIKTPLCFEPGPVRPTSLSLKKRRLNSSAFSPMVSFYATALLISFSPSFFFPSFLPPDSLSHLTHRVRVIVFAGGIAARFVRPPAYSNRVAHMNKPQRLLLPIPLLSSPLPSFLSGLGERCHRVWFVFVRTPAARFVGRSFPFPKLADGEV